ncbi:MAG: ABC transporter ATP-binding protein, partial [Phycisphaerales bacterium]
SAAICSLHDLGFASRIADDAWLLDAGRLVGAGAASRVLARDSLAAIFGESAIGLALGGPIGDG